MDDHDNRIRHLICRLLGNLFGLGTFQGWLIWNFPTRIKTLAVLENCR